MLLHLPSWFMFPWIGGILAVAYLEYRVNMKRRKKRKEEYLQMLYEEAENAPNPNYAFNPPPDESWRSENLLEMEDYPLTD